MPTGPEIPRQVWCFGGFGEDETWADREDELLDHGCERVVGPGRS
jgi:hypothetical protein